MSAVVVMLEADGEGFLELIKRITLHCLQTYRVDMNGNTVQPISGFCSFCWDLLLLEVDWVGFAIRIYIRRMRLLGKFQSNSTRFSTATDEGDHGGKQCNWNSRIVFSQPLFGPPRTEKSFAG